MSCAESLNLLQSPPNSFRKMEAYHIYFGERTIIIKFRYVYFKPKVTYEANVKWSVLSCILFYKKHLWRLYKSTYGDCHACLSAYYDCY